MEKMPDADGGAGAGASRKKWKPAKMSMEVYLNFIHSNKKLDLVVDHLNQIIRLHGFKKVAKQQKSVLMEAVNSMELMDPARSTVNVDGVSCEALLSIEEVIKDLSELNWQECCVTSLETLNAVMYHHQPPLQGDSPDAGGFASSTVSSLSASEQPRRKRRLRKLRDIINDRDDDVSGGGSAAACSSPLVVAKWMPTKKRKMRVRRINFGKIGRGGGGGRLDDTVLAARVKVENQLWPPSSSSAVRPFFSLFSN